MRKGQYAQVIREKLLKLGEDMLFADQKLSTDYEHMLGRLQAIEEETLDTGTFLPFFEASTLLRLTPYEKVLALMLWRQGEEGEGLLSVEKIRQIPEEWKQMEAGRGLAICFATAPQGMALSSVMLSYFREEEPQLPEGCTFVYGSTEQVYAGEDALTRGLRVFDAQMGERRPGDVEAEEATALVIAGIPGSGRHFLLEQICARRDTPLLWVPERERPYSLWERNEMILCGALYGGFLGVEVGRGANDELLRHLSQVLRFVGIVTGAGELWQRDLGYACVTVYTGELTREQRMGICRELFTEEEYDSLEQAGISRSQLEARQMPVGSYLRFLRNVKAELVCGNRPVPKSFYDAATTHLKLVETRRKFEELKLPPTQIDKLDAICRMIAARESVLEEWGFEQKFSYGNGVSLLFYGSPGTGKTMAAQVMANRLGMPLYRVDLSQLISKYIGETQKNIATVFDEAKRLDGILLFDEADAIFARRSEVTDSQDRYSNAETAYLLQRIEQHSGVSILATNLLQNFDEAFRRRISYLIHFPLPDEALREDLWRGIFPGQANVDEQMDWKALAQAFELSGASIRSAAMHAALSARAAGEAIGMRHVLDGIINEYSKQGKNLGNAQKELVRMYGA